MSEFRSLIMPYCQESRSVRNETIIELLRPIIISSGIEHIVTTSKTRISLVKGKMDIGKKIMEIINSSSTSSIFYLNVFTLYFLILFSMSSQFS